MRWVALLSLVVVGCSNTGKPNGPVGGDPCEKAETHVASLYRAQPSRASQAGDAAETSDDQATRRARQKEAIADNVEMMLTDCRTDPARFGPCLSSATSVAQMERDCLIPLDDRGEVEGAAFGGHAVDQ